MRTQLGSITHTHAGFTSARALVSETRSSAPLPALVSQFGAMKLITPHSTVSSLASREFRNACFHDLAAEFSSVLLYVKIFENGKQTKLMKEKSRMVDSETFFTGG